MGHTTRPRILQNDIHLFQAIGKHGFVDMQYILRFCYRGNQERTIKERITQLSRYQYLVYKKTYIPPEYTANTVTGYGVITLGSAGIRLMKSMQYDVMNNMAALHNSAPYRMYHQVQVATVCDAVMEAYEHPQSNWSVCDILNEREACIDGAGNQPDAILIFQPKSKAEVYVAVFIEIERSYASAHSIVRKLGSYRSNIERNAYKKVIHKNLIKQRVLFIPQTAGQFVHVIEKIRKSEYGKNIDVLVSPYQKVCCSSLEPIFMNPYTQNENKLLSKALK